MNGSKIFVLTTLAVALLLAIACGPRPINSPLLTLTLFAQGNMTFEREIVSAVNYRGGAPIPVGSKVQVLEVTEEMITFQVEESGLMLKFMNHRSSGRSIEDAFSSYFAPEDPAERIAALSETDRQQVEAGEIATGMTKEAVLLAYGPPPPHKTPTTEMSMWTYWRNRRATIEVHFDDNGLVMDAPAPIEPVETPAEPTEVYYATCNVHQEDGEVSWANYLKGPIIKLGTKVEVTDKGSSKVEFKDVETGMEYEFTNEQDKSGQPVWDLFLRVFSLEDPTPKLEALSETDKTSALGADVKKGMSREAVALAWCQAPPHETPSFESSTWTYWSSRMKKVKVNFGDDGKVKSIKK